MLDVAYYLVTREILERAGLAGQRYRSKDGRYVLDNKDLSRVRFTTDEYISGLQGVEKITTEQAKQAIAEGGYQMQMQEQSLTPDPSPKGEGSEQPANEGNEQPAEPEQEEEQPEESAPSDSVAGSEEVEPTQEEEEE